VPIEQSIRKLNLMDVLEAGIKHAAATNNKELSNQINKILENIAKLEEYGMVTKDDNYESFVHAVALEVANRAQVNEERGKTQKKDLMVVVVCRSARIRERKSVA
jgi:predicted transcriptional regulator YdeE